MIWAVEELGAVSARFVVAENHGVTFNAADIIRARNDLNQITETMRDLCNELFPPPVVDE